MNERYVFSPLERELTFSYFKRRFLKEGRAEGRSEEARALAMRVVRRRLGGALPAELEAALTACDVRERLESVVELAVEVGPGEEFVSVALERLRGEPAG